MSGNLKAADNVVKTLGTIFCVRAGGSGGGLWGATAGLPHHQFGRQDEAPWVGTALSIEALAGRVDVVFVAHEGDAFVAVPDEVLRGLPCPGAILDQHRVGLDPLGRTVKRDYRKPGPLLRL